MFTWAHPEKRGLIYIRPGPAQPSPPSRSLLPRLQSQAAPPPPHTASSPGRGRSSTPRHGTAQRQVEPPRRRHAGGVKGGGGAGAAASAAVEVPAGVRLLREQLRQAEQLPRRRRRARQGAGGAEGGPGVRRRQPGPDGGGRRGRAQGRRPRHRRHTYHSHGQGDHRRDGGRGARGGEHAPAQGRDGAQLRRLHRAPGRLRDAGRAAGGDRVGTARHPPQTGWVAERGRVLRLPPGVHRQGGGRRLHQALAAPHLRQRPRRPGPRPEARGV